MAAYSLDLRQRIVDAVERKDKSKREIAKLFGVHESFIYKLLRQKRLLDHIAPLPHGGGATAKLTQDHCLKFSDLVALTPDATLDQLRQQLKKKARLEISASTICRGLQALGLPRKKSRNAPPKLTPKRERRFASNNNS
jgi:transposase